MRWSPSMLSKLNAVRQMRLQAAELALARNERQLGVLRDAEAQARQALAATEARSAEEAQQANATLIRRATGGRAGISQWVAERKKAQTAVQVARVKVDDAMTQRVGQQHECEQARSVWRASRFAVERLNLLVEQIGKGAP